MSNFNTCEGAYPDVDEFLAALARESANLGDEALHPGQPLRDTKPDTEPVAHETLSGLASLAIVPLVESGV